MRGHIAGPPDSWVSVLFSTGINFGEMSPAWRDSDEKDVAYDKAGHQWGDGLTRIMRLKPTEDLIPGGNYTVSFNETAVPGVADTAWDLDFEMSFQVACDEATAAECADLGEMPSARLDGAADYQEEWTEQTSWDEPGSASEDGGGCAATANPVLALPVLMALYGVLRRRRILPHA